MKDKDWNKDGELSILEFAPVGIPWNEPHAPISAEHQQEFNKYDTDGSGKLSIQELRVWERAAAGALRGHEAMKQLFEIADKDSDKHITAEEIEASVNAIAGSAAH